MVRDYIGELSQLRKSVEVDLYDTIKKCMELDIFNREDLSTKEHWYKFPYEIGVKIEGSDEWASAHSFIPEGTVYQNGFVVPEGGVIYTDHERAEELEVRDLGMYGMVDMLDELKHMVENKDKVKENG